MTQSRMHARTMGVLLALTLALPAAAGAQTAFAWPARDLDDARYSWPEQCMALAGRLEANAWRGDARAMRDTLPYDPQDTLPASVVAAVRTCVAKFPIERAAPLELSWLFHLELVAHQDVQVKRVVERQLALARTRPARASVLAAAVPALLAARPARVREALSYAARVDSLTGVADEVRRAVHRQLASYAISVLDTTLLISQLAAYRTDDEAVDVLSSVALRMLRQRTPDEATAIREEMLARAAATGATAPSQLLEMVDRMVAPAGRPPIAANFWISSLPGDTIRPAPGKVSLLVFVGERCGGRGASACAPNYAVLRRLHQRFGATLDITLMARTDGYFRSYAPPTPAEEAELLRQYFLEDVGLSGALSVVTTPFTRLPNPDGRRRDGATPNLHYFGWTEQDGTDNRAPEWFLNAFLVGPDGLVKLRSGCTPDQERLLTALIAKLISAR